MCLSLFIIVRLLSKDSSLEAKRVSKPLSPAGLATASLMSSFAVALSSLRIWKKEVNHTDP
jgi:hypothetical protein